MAVMVQMAYRDNTYFGSGDKAHAWTLAQKEENVVRDSLRINRYIEVLPKQQALLIYWLPLTQWYAPLALRLQVGDVFLYAVFLPI